MEGSVMTPAEAATAILDAVEKNEQESELAEAYRAGARNHCSDGELEVDEGAVVSFGSDKGAYVAAWIWVSDEDAGVKTCYECGESTINPNDDWGLDTDDNDVCPACATE